uniref:DUF547 domain-containing protein n=1 Tax=Meloidogyne enterolobii TaxID=390850 RepID=A0A6V7UJK7_MELEN|nr:unnamed protein product [Meloidogyne enterolobii]
MFLQVYIVMFPENIYNSNISVNEYSPLSGKYTKTLKNTKNTIINASENTFNFNLIFIKHTFKNKNMSKTNREQTQQERAQRFRNQVKYRSEAIQKGQYLLDENVIELMEQKRSGSFDNSSPVPIIDEQQMKENNRETMTSRRSMTTLPEMGRSFSTERYYKLVDGESDQKLPLNMIHDENEDINNFEVEDKPKINVKEFNKRFISVIDKIYERILSENKRTVHLDLLDDFEPFQTEYASLAQEIAYLNLIEANEQERLAIFINIYNIMLIHISYKYGLPGTIWQRRKYLYFTYYNIGGHLYSLQSIFNGILRGNHTGLGMLWKPFGEQDYRNKFIIRGGEPLAHFGLNNYTRSTPPIRTYSIEGIYDELSDNARQCLKSSEFLQVDLKGEKVLVAKLFKQYSEDFCSLGTKRSTDELLKWLVNVLKPNDERAQQLTKLLNTKNYTIGYLTMDNDLNISYGITQYKNRQEQFDDENDDLIL